LPMPRSGKRWRGTAPPRTTNAQRTVPMTAALMPLSCPPRDLTLRRPVAASPLATDGCRIRAGQLANAPRRTRTYNPLIKRRLGAKATKCRETLIIITFDSISEAVARAFQERYTLARHGGKGVLESLIIPWGFRTLPLSSADWVFSIRGKYRALAHVK